MMEKLQESLTKVQEILNSLHRDYVGWVLKNPCRASDTESVIKLLSYLLHGRLNKNNSTILPELIYCGANLLAFWHDRILQQERERRVKEEEGGGGARNGNGHYGNGVGVGNGRGTLLDLDGPSVSGELQARQRELREGQIKRIRTTLTIIDYLEVFLEVSARQLWGEVGRWTVILVLQSVKTGLRAALLLHFKVGLIGSSTLYQRRYGRKDGMGSSQYQPNVTFVLKHSGKTIRKIQSAPPARNRDFTAPVTEASLYGPYELTPIRKVAEIIHLLRPMAHLASMGIWGTKSWKPWMISFAMDVTSLRLHSQTHNLRRDEKIELTRRTYTLCYYLMRSPFYDTCTKKRLLGTLVYFSQRIPILGHICGVLAQAIPEWQTTYSYMWTDY